VGNYRSQQGLHNLRGYGVHHRIEDHSYTDEEPQHRPDVPEPLYHRSSESGDCLARLSGENAIKSSGHESRYDLPAAPGVQDQEHGDDRRQVGHKWHPGRLGGNVH